MKLITAELKRTVPALYAQDGKGEEAVVHFKLFNPAGAGTWYITEACAYTEDGREVPLAEVEGNFPDIASNGATMPPGIEDVRLFGYTTGLGYNELGYTSLRELSELKLRFGLKIERDAHWTPRTMGEVQEKEPVG